MSELTRRHLLAGAAATAAVTALPSIAAAGPTEPLVAWAVGTPGEWDWQVVRARNDAEAILEWLAEKTGARACEETPTCDPDDPSCDFCTARRASDVYADRRPEWDGKEVNNALWLNSGMGGCCDRCGDETSLDDGGRAVEDEIVCAECMRIEDWDKADLERAAEIREELAGDDA